MISKYFRQIIKIFSLIIIGVEGILIFKTLSKIFGFSYPLTGIRGYDYRATDVYSINCISEFWIVVKINIIINKLVNIFQNEFKKL